MTDNHTPPRPTWTTDGAELSAALARLSHVVGKGRGVGTWVLAPTKITLEWSGAHEEVKAEGTESLIVTFTPTVMANLARLVPTSSPVTINVADARLKIGKMAIRCTVVPRKPLDVLTVNASALDILLLGLQHSADDLESAGLTGDVAHEEGRRYESVERAAIPLNWLGIDAGLLNRWVTAHLSAKAKGQATFELGRAIVVDQLGQVALFETATRRRT